MRKIGLVAILVGAGVALLLPLGRQTAAEQDPPSCVVCHERINPGIVAQWRASKHSKVEPFRVDCTVCHGTGHETMDDFDRAKFPTPKVCKTCHAKQVDQFEHGKHARAQMSVNAIPMLAEQPWSIQLLGCQGCHQVGKKWDDGTVGRCDSCHTRHLFSKEEAKKPEACETCHMGEDHSQYEMWRSSKHGIIHDVMPEMGRAPVCQTCHMQEGDHAVMTGWGFLGLRLPIEDEDWQNAVMTIVKAIGPWGRDEAGMEARVGAIKALELARLDQASFDAARTKMENACAQCHSREYGKRHLARADAVIKETTLLLARAVKVVEDLYTDGVLPETEGGPSHPDLLRFYESPTEIEQELYKMFLFHRQKAFQGAIHVNPDYMHWYGWAPMKTSMKKIERLARKMREEAAAKK